MGRLLAPKDATQRFGVSAETLRRWEREGRIAPTERTMGGQRRYDEDDIARLMESGARRVGPTPPLPSALPPTPQPDEPPRTAPLASPELPAWERRVRWAEAGLAVDKVKRERLALRREVHEEREKREREAKQAEHMAKLAAERAAAAEADARRLARLREYGRLLASGAPLEWQTKITAAIEEFVTIKHFPADLPVITANLYVGDFVGRMLATMREAHTAQQKGEEREHRRRSDEAERERLRESLISTGIGRCSWATFDWDDESKRDARAQVGKVLRDEVRADWTTEDVGQLVDEVLSEWEDDEWEGDEE